MPKYSEVGRKVSPTRVNDSVGASLSCFLGCLHVSTFSADVRGSSSLVTTTRTCIVYAASRIVVLVERERRKISGEIVYPVPL